MKMIRGLKKKKIKIFFLENFDFGEQVDDWGFGIEEKIFFCFGLNSHSNNSLLDVIPKAFDPQI